MARLMEVLGRVLAGRGVAAADMAARQAQPQVHPAASGLQALLASLAARGDIADLIEVAAVLR